MLFRTSSPKAMVISYHDELENTHVLHFDQARWTHLTCDHSYIRTKIILILRIPRNKLEYTDQELKNMCTLKVTIMSTIQAVIKCLRFLNWI